MCFASISRILLSITIYLGLLLPINSSGTSLDYSRDTALHRSKDLAVSLWLYNYGQTYPTYSCEHAGQLKLFNFNRLCSHLVDCSRRALPATLLLSFESRCSDFPHIATFR